jgi:hypothetical protein
MAKYHARYQSFINIHKSYLFTVSDLETNLLKFELGISNGLASLLYLPLVSGDNNFVRRSSAR